MPDKAQKEPQYLCGRGKASSTPLQGYRNVGNATCYISACVASLRHVPTLRNIDMLEWKRACGCGPEVCCYSCHLASQLFDDSKKSNSKADKLTKALTGQKTDNKLKSAQTEHRLEWLFRRLSGVRVGLIQPKRQRPIDLHRPHTVSSTHGAPCKLFQCFNLACFCSLPQRTWTLKWQTLPSSLKPTSELVRLNSKLCAQR